MTAHHRYLILSPRERWLVRSTERQTLRELAHNPAYQGHRYADVAEAVQRHIDRLERLDPLEAEPPAGPCEYPGGYAGGALLCGLERGHGGPHATEAVPPWPPTPPRLGLSWIRYLVRRIRGGSR